MKVIGSSHHRFTKQRLCLYNMIAFHNEMTSLVDKGRAVYLDINKAFNTFTYSILVQTDEVQAG